MEPSNSKRKVIIIFIANNKLQTNLITNTRILNFYQIIWQKRCHRIWLRQRFLIFYYIFLNIHFVTKSCFEILKFLLFTFSGTLINKLLYNCIFGPNHLNQNFYKHSNKLIAITRNSLIEIKNSLRRIFLIISLVDCLSVC